MYNKSSYNIRFYLIIAITCIIGSVLSLSLMSKVISGQEVPILDFLASWKMAFLLVLLPIGILIYCIAVAIKNVKLLGRLLNAKVTSLLLTIFFYKRITSDYKGRSIIVGKWFFQIPNFDFVIKPRSTNKIEIP